VDFSSIYVCHCCRTMIYLGAYARAQEMETYLKIWFNLMPFYIDLQMKHSRLLQHEWFINAVIISAFMTSFWSLPRHFYKLLFPPHSLLISFRLGNNSKRFSREGIFFVRTIKYSAITLRYFNYNNNNTMHRSPNDHVTIKLLHFSYKAQHNSFVADNIYVNDKEK